MVLASRKKAKPEEETNKRRIVDFSGDVSECLVEMALKMEEEEKQQQETDPIILSVESSKTTLSSLTGNSNDHNHTRKYLSNKEKISHHVNRPEKSFASTLHVVQSR